MTGKCRSPDAGDLKRLIVGRDPLEIERMRFEVYRDIKTSR